MVDGSGLIGRGVIAAGRIAATTGCQVYSPTFPARVEAGPDLPVVNRLPYFPEQIMEMLAPVRKLVLVGGERPVSFFAYRNMPSDLVPDHCEVIRIAHRHEDVVQVLEDLADALDAPAPELPRGARPGVPDGRLNTRSISAILAARAPDDCIVAVDSGGGGAAYPALAALRAAHLAESDRRFHRPRRTGCGRRRHRVSRSPGVRVARRRRRDVHEPVPVDGRSRAVECDRGDLLQSAIQHPRGGVPQARHQRHR